MRSFGRKATIFLIIIICGIASSFFMELEFFTKFLESLVYVALGFFMGNGIEHVAGIFKKWGNMKKIILFTILATIILSCCTVKMQEGETELSFIIRQCTNDAKKSGNFSACQRLIDQYVKTQDDDRLYKRYEYCQKFRDESQKFSECWLTLNQR